MNESIYAVPIEAAENIMSISSKGAVEVIRIDKAGRLFWHGREVETDDDFRAAMLECAQRFAGIKKGS